MASLKHTRVIGKDGQCSYVLVTIPCGEKVMQVYNFYVNKGGRKRINSPESRAYLERRWNDAIKAN